MHRSVKRIHMVGIGGVGMCGIAELLSNLDYQVSGSDLQENANTRRLQQLGVTIHIGHDPKLVQDADVVVISSAVNEGNTEVAAARRAKIPVIPRAEMLGELMQFQQGVAVAGTHGKTTTTSFIASLLAEGGLDPTFVIGGRLNSAGANARLGQGKYLVAEADESDASFLQLRPHIAVVTNIDNDHLATYGGDFGQLKQTFITFLQNLPFYGLAIVCAEDPVVQQILPALHKPIMTYGFGPDVDVRASNIEQKRLQMFFDVSFKDKDEALAITLNHPGKHNVLNALAAITVAQVVGVDDAAIKAGCEKFSGIGRRFQINDCIGLDGGDVMFIDDYAHHPREIAATIAAAKGGWPERRLVVVFQPHRYSRTHDLLDDFSAILSDQPQLVVTEVYAAGEQANTVADGRALCRAIRARGRSNPVFVEQLSQLPQVLKDIVQANDLVLTLGAGSIGQIAADLPQQLAAECSQ